MEVLIQFREKTGKKKVKYNWPKYYWHADDVPIGVAVGNSVHEFALSELGVDPSSGDQLPRGMLVVTVDVGTAEG